MNLYFDPYVLACNKNSILKCEFDEYIFNLVEWSETIENNWGKVYILEETYELLHNKGLYPLTPVIQSLIEEHNIIYIQTSDVDKIINSILNKLPTIDKSIGISECIFEIVKFEFDVLQPRDIDFLESLQKLLILVSLECLLKNQRTDSKILISKEFGKNKVSIEADSIEWDSDIPIPITQPYSLDFSLCAINNFSNFINMILPETVWINAISRECFNIALQMQIYKIDSSIKLFYKNNLNYSFQESFFETCTNLLFDSQEGKAKMLLRALAEEILGKNKNDTHHLRINETGNAPQIAKEDFKAWRRDIDREYHLHYWRNGDIIKFANVVPHNDFKITWE